MAAVRKIALFGGTFDPVHHGHLHLASAAVDELGLDEVRFLPCRISPHKQHRAPTPAADRLEMLRLATAGLPWAVVDDCEAKREGPSYSYQTAEAMAARFPQARLFWIMGGDQWAVLEQWAESQRLAACVEFIVFTRDGAGDLAPRAGYRLHSLHTSHPASSTVIREALVAGATNHEWLAENVCDYIRSHGLYRAAQ
jgi:nicotinate-nucleotide adenylyltransferase